MLNIITAGICAAASGMMLFMALHVDSKRDRIKHFIWAVLLFGLSVMNFSMK